MSHVRIRDARPEDAPAILAINADGVPGVSALTRETLADLLERATCFRVAETGHGLAGYVILFAADAAYDGEEFLWFQGRLAAGRIAPFLYIDQVAVAGRTRRSGVATTLYDDVANAARLRGLSLLTCEVNLRPENPASIRFHHRNGFREIGTLETRDGRRVSLLLRSLVP